MERNDTEFVYEEVEIDNVSLEAAGGLVQYLGNWGVDGWEMVEHKQYDNKHYFLFKRGMKLEKID